MIRSKEELEDLFLRTIAAYEENFAEKYTDASLWEALEGEMMQRKIAFVRKRLGHLGDQDFCNYSKLRFAPPQVAKQEVKECRQDKSPSSKKQK